MTDKQLNKYIFLAVVGFGAYYFWTKNKRLNEFDERVNKAKNALIGKYEAKRFKQERLFKNEFLRQLKKYEKKMVQFARAIIIRPRLLLLDNFFTGLNNDYEKKISYLLLALKKIGTTIISFRGQNNAGILSYNESYKIENSLLIKL